MSMSSRPLETKYYLREPKTWLLAATIAVFGIGFVDLWRGGITLSAFALALGYCGLLPAFLWQDWQNASQRRAGQGRTKSIEGEAPPYLAAGLASLAIGALYIVTMAPNTAMWDTSEYIAAAYTFGLPHPPGNPFFIILGRVFSLLPIAPNVAARINVLAALCSAISAGLWFLVTDQVLRAWTASKAVRLAGASTAALVGATAFTVWNQSVVNEKVYTVSLLGIAIISWLAVRWSVDPDDRKSDHRLVLIAYLCGLGYANHMAGMLPVPAIVGAVLLRRPRTFVRWRLLLACAVALAVGLSPFATQPIRAAYHPAMNEGEPTGCRDTIGFSCTFSKATYTRFKYNLDRGQYGKPNLADRQASFGDQLGMWWMYFRWQWWRNPTETMPFIQSLLAAVFFVLGLAGGWTHYARDRRTFWYMGALLFTTTLALIFYLNFKLGASQPGSPSSDHEVRDRDYFFLWSFSAWSVWAALGLVTLWETFAAMIGVHERRYGKQAFTEPTVRGWTLTSPALALALVPLFANWHSASRAQHRTTRNIAADLLNSVEPYGVLVTVGDNDTFPLWYAQEVEGIRRDVVVAVTSLLNTDWYGRQLVRRPVYEYDARRGPAVYRDRTWPKPVRGPLHMTLDDVDTVPEYVQLPAPTPFELGPYHVTVDARQLQYGVLERADMLVLRMIQDSWKERPFYFSRSGGGYPQALGFGNNILSQGLAWKLFVPPAQPTRDTLPVQGEGWLDLPRSRTLWNDVFTGQQSTIAEGQWVDRPSASMPLLYVFAGATLAEGLRVTGDSTGARQVLATAGDVARIAGYPDLLRALTTPQPWPTTGPTDVPAAQSRSSDAMTAPPAPRPRSSGP